MLKPVPPEGCGKKRRCNIWKQLKKASAGVSFTEPGSKRQGRPESPLGEGLRKFALVESAEICPPRSAYYGISASRYLEPLDQADVLLLCSRLRRSGMDLNLSIFVAGRYAQLNGKPAGELIEAESRKLETLQAAARALGMPVALFRTDDLWQDSRYWDEVWERRGASGIISGRSGAPFSEVAASMEPGILAAMPPGFLECLGNVDAPALYRLFEVAEAAYLARVAGVDCKIGPASEQEYDVFIRSFMGIIQLGQPLDFRSTPARPKPITPYIGKEGEERLFIQDSKEAVVGKICRLGQRAEGTPLFYGDFMNPFLRTAILAVEAAALAESTPVRLAGSRVYDGAGAAGVFARSGMRGLARTAPLVAECLWAYLIRPIQKAMDGGACA